MPRLKVRTTLDATPSQVWDEIQDIASHPDWMQDAVSIHFVSERRSGVGTSFDCETRVGPFRLVDRMEITSWRPGREMGVRHHGLVTGTGRFELRPARRGRTRFTWVERLQFPWYFGGPVGAWVARPVLRRVWRANLRNLRERFASD
ncbi:MAG: SRPBCC family protein [Actinomycetota bacterium]|nr:SRPBCC family protein [Actinomycetota bacterium]